MVIALFTKGNQKISWGVPWKTMVRFSKPWETHNMPWELRDAMGITLVAMGNPINPWGIPYGVFQQAMGYPQYAMGIMGRHGDYACRQGKSDKFMVYKMGNMVYYSKPWDAG
jgi:hypothetical protein